MIREVILSVINFNVLGETGEFTSPNYPNKYPDNAYCTWTIIGRPEKAIRVTFVDFAVEYESTCKFDVVRAFRGREAGGRRIFQYELILILSYKSIV